MYNELNTDWHKGNNKDFEYRKKKAVAFIKRRYGGWDNLPEYPVEIGDHHKWELDFGKWYGGPRPKEKDCFRARMAQHFHEYFTMRYVDPQNKHQIVEVYYKMHWNWKLNDYALRYYGHKLEKLEDDADSDWFSYRAW